MKIIAVFINKIIDEMFDPAQISHHIEFMTPTQRCVHAWLTGTVDVAYPFAYASFFVGIAIRFFGRIGPWLAIPSFLVIPTDLLEGFAQIMLLNGYDSYLQLKVVVTPIKLVLFLTGLVVTIAGLLRGLRRRLQARKTR